jgi:hypothetical protein
MRSPEEAFMHRSLIVLDLDEFRRGLEVEFEHGVRDPETDVTHGDMVLTGKIALAHLKEFPDYYTRLDQMGKEADAYWASRRAPHSNRFRNDSLDAPDSHAVGKEQP